MNRGAIFVLFVAYAYSQLTCVLNKDVLVDCEQQSCDWTNASIWSACGGSFPLNTADNRVDVIMEDPIVVFLVRLNQSVNINSLSLGDSEHNSTQALEIFETSFTMNSSTILNSGAFIITNSQIRVGSLVSNGSIIFSGGSISGLSLVQNGNTFLDSNVEFNIPSSFTGPLNITSGHVVCRDEFSSNMLTVNAEGTLSFLSASSFSYLVNYGTIAWVEESGLLPYTSGAYIANYGNIYFQSDRSLFDLGPNGKFKNFGRSQIDKPTILNTYFYNYGSLEINAQTTIQDLVLSDESLEPLTVMGSGPLIITGTTLWYSGIVNITNITIESEFRMTQGGPYDLECDEITFLPNSTIKFNLITTSLDTSYLQVTGNVTVLGSVELGLFNPFIMNDGDVLTLIESDVGLSGYVDQLNVLDTEGDANGCKFTLQYTETKLQVLCTTSNPYKPSTTGSSTPPEKDHHGGTIAAVIIIILVVAAAGVGGYLYWRRRTHGYIYRRTTYQEL